ncbi:MAG: hypothetical protein QOE94_1550 [Mycobacterium sp.]|jgi:hypothetical protein|nr:hypothetical protein [Mycobacterium sp.]
MIVARTFSTTTDTALFNNAVNMAGRQQKALWLNPVAAPDGHAFGQPQASMDRTFSGDTPTRYPYLVCYVRDVPMTAALLAA